MKRVGYIYDSICDISNIKHAIMKASLGKRHQKRIKNIIKNIDIYAGKIRELLLSKSYEPSPYIIKKIYDGANKKERTIYKPMFYPDQIIHWALMLQIEPVIMRGMYQYCCGSVPGRGTGYGQKTLRKWLDVDRKGTKYCLKMDISKFYPSISNERLKQKFRTKIKDSDCLWLIDAIIDSSDGLPIGNYTSQWFSNFYLETLDHWIKEYMDVRYYIRYVDDLVILGANKKHLHKVREIIADYLEIMELQMKPNWQVFRFDYMDKNGKQHGRDIDFLGFRFFRDKTILRKKNALRIKRRASKIKKKGNLNYRDACAIVSYWGWIKRSNSYQFYNKSVKPLVSINAARKVVSSICRLKNTAALKKAN